MIRVQRLWCGAVRKPLNLADKTLRSRALWYSRSRSLPFRLHPLAPLRARLHRRIVFDQVAWTPPEDFQTGKLPRL